MLFPDGSQAADNDLINPFQWDFFKEALQPSGQFEHVHVLVVCSELPIIDSSGESIEKLYKSSSRYQYLSSTWSRHPMAQSRLLRLLTDWRFAVCALNPWR